MTRPEVLPGCVIYKENLWTYTFLQQRYTFLEIRFLPEIDLAKYDLYKTPGLVLGLGCPPEK